MGALLLNRTGTVLIIISCLAGLWFVYAGDPHASMHHGSHGQSYFSHLQGMWIANSLGVFLICGWIYYLRHMNEKVVMNHQKTQEVLANIEKVESLGRLAASAAHHINTPLGTIQLGLSELSDQKNPINKEDHQRWMTDMQQAVVEIRSVIDLSLIHI